MVCSEFCLFAAKITKGRLALFLNLRVVVREIYDLDIFIPVLVLVVDNTVVVAAAADHSHPPRQWVLHMEEDNSLPRLPVPVPEPSSYENTTLYVCV